MLYSLYVWGFTRLPQHVLFVSEINNQAITLLFDPQTNKQTNTHTVLGKMEESPRGVSRNLHLYLAVCRVP